MFFNPQMIFIFLFSLFRPTSLLHLLNKLRKLYLVEYQVKLNELMFYNISMM